MAGSPQRSLWIAGAALVVALFAVAAVLVIGARMRGAGPAAGTSELSVGEVIFRTGRDASGAVIPRSGNANGGGMMGGGLMGGGCARCHGSDGRGRSTMMFTAPNITYGNLTDPQGMLEPDGGRGPTFTDAALRTAVVQGLDPEGSRLEWPMPRWQLTDQDWSDLLAYLKTLR